MKFVIENEKIVGVVHIVDYNNEFVAVELYRAFFRFENNLRNLLVRKKYNNGNSLQCIGFQIDIEIKDNNNSDYWTKKYQSYFPIDEKYKIVK